MSQHQNKGDDLNHSSLGYAGGRMNLIQYGPEMLRALETLPRRPWGISVAAIMALNMGLHSGAASAVVIGFETPFSAVTTDGVFYTENGMEFDFHGPLDTYSLSASQGFTSRYVDFHDHDSNNVTDSSYIEMRLV